MQELQVGNKYMYVLTLPDTMTLISGPFRGLTKSEDHWSCIAHLSA